MVLLSKRRSNILLVVLGLLLIPLIAMQFSSAVDWGVFDFLIMGSLLFGAGLAIEWAWVKVNPMTYRWLVISLILVAFLLLWAEMAVGIFGTPLAGN